MTSKVNSGRPIVNETHTVLRAQHRIGETAPDVVPSRRVADAGPSAVSRRDLAAKLFAGAAIVGLSGCIEPGNRDGSESVATAQALSGGNFLWADTLPDLRAVIGSDTSTTSKPVIVLGGYATVGDGGGGLFYWDSSSSTGDNGGTIIVPTGSTTGRWVRLTGGNFLWADTLTDLRHMIGSDPTTTLRSVILLGGYATVGDGGGGVFYWDSSSSTGDNGGTIIVPTGSTTGRWVRQYSGGINVRWFGAGLGGADDSASMQAAVEVAIHTAGNLALGATVYLPAGVYHLQNPVYIETSDTQYGGFVSVRLVGEGKYNTHIQIGPNSTAFVFGGLSQASNSQGPGWRIRHSEISDLSIEQVVPATSTTGTIDFLGGGIGFLIRDVAMYNVWNGITCSGTPSIITWRAKIQNVHMEGVSNAGIYAAFANNWDVSQTYIGAAGHTLNTAGIWLDTGAQGWMFTVNETGGFDTGLRMTSNFAGRPPDTHEFVQCNFDAGGRACIWLSNSHRCRFQGCYASSTVSTLTSVIVIDNADVYGFEWVDSVILNAYNSAISVSDATSFSIIDSTFATWATLMTNPGTYPAIKIAGAATSGAAHMSFIITGNTFFNDPDFPAFADGTTNKNLLQPILVQGSPHGFYLKYIVTNNIAYGTGMIGYANNGTAVSGAFVFNNNI